MMLNINMIGNMNTHLKTLEMKAVWEQKRRTGDYTPTGDTSIDQWQKAMETLNGADEEGSKTDDKLKEIHQKIEMGGKLTQEEMDYLRTKDPETYAGLIQERQEQKAYEQALRRCKTREEAERLKLGRLSSSMMVVRSVENNPSIPPEKKLKIVMREKRLVDDVAESTRKFVESGEYEKLPTEAEEAQAMREAAEKRHPVPESTGDTDAEHPAEAPDTERAQFTETEETETEQESEAARKVRRARAKAAYAAVQGDAGRASDSGWTERV